MTDDDEIFDCLKYSVIKDGNNVYYHNSDGKYHRKDDLPAVLENGNQEWWINGKRHRDNDKPAVIRASGTLQWWVNGQLHREGAPAIIDSYGSEFWYADGVPNRTDGPATFHKNGQNHWWVDGTLCETQRQFMKATGITTEEMIAITSKYGWKAKKPSTS